MAKGHEPGHAHAGGHSPHLAHHFQSMGQQHQAGKTGMWLFLSTEILLFSGLFCAYAVYRHNHPEIFLYAHRYLDKTLGGINTLVLILSSLTAAWAVRAAQLGQRRRLINLIVVTLICGVGFMGIKGIEYQHKWKHGLLWGQRFNPDTHAAHGTEAGGAAATHTAEGGGHAATPGADAGAAVKGAAASGHDAAVATPAGTTPAPTAGTTPPAAVSATPANPLEIHTQLKAAAPAPGGLARETAEGAGASGHAVVDRPRNAQVFFGIYFAMTGLHALHVIAGMLAWIWILRRAIRGDFGSGYFTPVDLVALYWHLVDLIWIYLFPLLYLIH